MRRVKPLSVVVVGIIAAWIPAMGPSSAKGAGLLIADGGFGGQLRIQRQEVDVVINNGVAVTTVEQTFRNTEDRIVEALYTFPVPKGASVANFSMWINGKEMIGEVVEKQRAREIYESYKQTRKDPGLLEQVDFKTFEMRIFPIAAGAEQRVRISYYQELEFDHDWATYVYPLSTTSRDEIADTATGEFSFQLDVRSEVPIVEMHSPSHQDAVAISEFSEELLRASLETGDTQLSRDVVVAYKVKRPLTGIDVISNNLNGNDGYLQLTMSVGKELEQQEKGMDYVFVLDVSGSMRTDDKLVASGSSIGAFIENLSSQDRFELITFNDMPEALFGTSVTVGTAEMEKAINLLRQVRARGGTSLQPAIEMAYRYLDVDRPLNVVILSDGMTEGREGQQLVQLIEQRPAGTRVFAVGVGNEVNRPLLRDLALRSGGLAAFISNGDDFERQATAFRRKLLRPAIENVTVQFDGNVYDVEPGKLGSLYHGAPVRLYARYRRGGTTEVTINGSIMGAPFSKTASIELESKGDANPELERMWAWHRVQRLLGEIRDRGANRSLQTEIVNLCEQYSIVSEYASFIVLENDAEFQRWRIDRRNAQRMLRDRAAQERSRQRLQQMRDRAMAKLGPSPSELPTAKRSPVSMTPRRSNFQPLARRTPPRNSGFDLTPPATQRRRNSGGGGGGGALDPITGTLAIGLGAMGWIARRRKT